jgi:hypothetical protein
VFNLFNLVIERLADGVRPFAGGILRLLPSVWHQAEGQSLLRIQARPCTAPPCRTITRAQLPMHAQHHACMHASASVRLDACMHARMREQPAGSRVLQ